VHAISPAAEYWPFAHDAHAVAALFVPSDAHASTTSASNAVYVQAPALLQLVVLVETSPEITAAVQAEASVAAQASNTSPLYAWYVQAPALLQFEELEAALEHTKVSVATQVFALPDAHVHAPAFSQALCALPS
jgi:hypothetical protein